jgi:DNA-directed RNA polymerase subunit RPC12/RpoP
MASLTVTSTEIQCLNCGFEASANSDQWETTDHPPVGTLTQCPECSSTDTSRLR